MRRLRNNSIVIFFHGRFFCVIFKMTFNAKNGEICRGFWNKEAILINYLSESVVEQEKLTLVFQLTKASKVISN